MEIFESYLKCLKNNNPLVKAISPPLIMENSKNILIELSIPEEYCQFLTINNGVILGEFELLSLERMKSEKVNMQSVYG